MSDIRVTYTGLISFLGGIIALGSGIIFTLIVTRTLSPEEYGSWGLILSVVGYFVMIQPIITYWSTREIARNLDSGKTAVTSSVGLSFGVLPIFIIISFFLADQTGINQDVFFLAVILIPTTFLSGILAAINMGYKPHAIGFGTIFFGLSEIPLALIFVYYLGMGISGVILTIAIAHIVYIIILFIYARQKIRNKFKKEYVRKWLKFSWIPLYPSVYNILGEFTFVIFILISGSIIGIAYWTASLVLASIIAPAGLISRAMYPKLLEDKGKTFFRDNITLLFYFGILFTSLVIIFARPGLFALNPFYEIAVPVVVILAIEGFLVLLTNMFQTALIGIEKVDTFTGSTSKDYLKSNLFHVHTLRLIQTVSYVIILVVGLIILTQYTNSEIDLLVYWAMIALITQIPLVSYFAILIRRNFESPFDLKRILKFLIVSIAVSILTHFLLEEFITYSIDDCSYFIHPVEGCIPDLYLFLPSVLLLIIFGVGIYFISTYIIDKKTRDLFSAIIEEIKSRLQKKVGNIPKPDSNMISGDIYNEQIARYEFSSDFVSKRVLDITDNRFLDYFSSRLLLRKNVSEIVNLNYHKDKIEYTLRRKGKNNSVEFKVINKSNLLEENSFDAIISFETIQHEKNQSDSLKKKFKLLKKGGVLIISTINKDLSQENYNLSRNEINNELDKLQFLKILKETFSEVNLFSQTIPISSTKTKNHFNKIRGSHHKTRLKIFMCLRMYSLYRLFFNETIASKTENDIEHFMLDIRSTEYFPSMYVNGDQPLFFVAVCRK